MSQIFTLFATFGLDLLTKRWADKKLPLNRKKEIVRNHLYFWHIKNKGIAYNRFSGKRNGILAFTGTLLAGYTGFFLQSLSGKRSKKYALPLALTLGGGYGNFWERWKKGAVTDFLFIPAEGKNTPIFNVADAAILLGSVWLTVISFIENYKK